MSRMSRNWMLAVLAIAGLFVMVGCQAEGTAQISDKAGVAQEIPQLRSAYLAVASAKHRQSPYSSTRLPIRQKEKRNFRNLARQCEELLREVETWDSDARLTGIGEADRSVARTSIASLRASLGDLKLAAKGRNIAAVRASYEQATGHYQQVVSLTGPIN